MKPVLIAATMLLAAAGLALAVDPVTEHWKDDEGDNMVLEVLPDSFNGIYDGGRVMAPEVPCDQNGRSAFGRIENQGGRRGAVFAGAQHIGGAGSAGAHFPNVASAGHAREDQAERDGAEQIADEKPETEKIQMQGNADV